jgi:hypothetical protein
MPRRLAVLLAPAIFTVALWCRWHSPSPEAGALFYPRPDALEYAAAAQSLADSGEFYLQVGPLRVRPRYPPGWPMFVAAAIRSGVAGENLWRTGAIFGAALAVLLALAAAGSAWWLASRSPPRRRAGAALLAGLVAGGSWALAPAAVWTSQHLLSDEPAALVAILALLFGALGALLPASRRVLVLCALSGVAAGCAAAVRPIVAALLLAPLAILWLGAVRVPFGRAGARLAWWTAGAALFPTLVVLVLLRSGLPPTAWSGYAFWAPRFYADASTTFNGRYLFGGGVPFPVLQTAGGRPVGNLAGGLRTLLGVPGMRHREGQPVEFLGAFLPLLGWGLAVALRRRLETRGADNRALRLGAAAIAVWLALHVVVFGVYVFQDPRFFMAPLAAAATALGVGCGALFASGRRSLCLGALSLALLALVSTSVSLARSRLAVQPPDPEVRRAFAAWLRTSEQERARSPLPFDPVHAQALGLLPKSVAETICAWGILPRTSHVLLLQHYKYLPNAPLADCAVRPEAVVWARPRARLR